MLQSLVILAHTTLDYLNLDRLQSIPKRPGDSFSTKYGYKSPHNISLNRSSVIAAAQFRAYL